MHLQVPQRRPRGTSRTPSPPAHLHDELDQPLTGWLGHAQPFAMERDYRPGRGDDTGCG
ncbi:MAG: hypothetical protein WKF83_16975 [Nocardioidaceae bacterium]